MSPETTDTGADSALEALFYRTDRVRFIYWRRYSSGKQAVYAVMVVTVLAFVTGLSNVSQDAVHLEGPLAAVLPPVEGYVRIAGVFVSFLLAIVTYGLNRHKRVALYAALVTLPATALLPLATFQTTDVPLFAAILVSVVLLVRNRSQFDRRLDLSSLQIASVSAIAAVLCYGTVGSYVMREQFVQIETWGDAVYYVIVSIATVGYGDITPVTAEAKWFSLSVILLGTGAFTAAIGALVIPAIEKRMAAAVGHMTPSELTFLEDHVLVLGYGELTESILERVAADADVVVVTEDTSDATTLDDDEVAVLTGDPTDTRTLQDARIDSARGVVVATEDDARDVLAVIAARQANPDVHIVAAASDPHHVDKLEVVGADEVVSPTVIVGRLLGTSVLEASPVGSEEGGDGDGDDRAESGGGDT